MIVTGLHTGLTEEEKDEKARAKEALNEDGDSDDDGDTRKAATYGNKKTEVCNPSSSLPVEVANLCTVPEKVCVYG